MPDQDFRGRVAVVTGASLGIGRATAVAFGREGARVVVNYRSHREHAEGGVQAVGEKLIARTVEEFGQLHIAVSNAAYSDRELFFQADMAGFRRTVDVTMW